MDSEKYEDILYDHRILRWSARILGTIEVVLLFYLTFNEFREEINSHSPSPLLTLINGQYFLAVTLTIAFIGLIIAYRKEGLGGGISIVSFIVLFIGWSDFHVNFILGMTLASLPAILYVTYWLTVYLDLKKTKWDQMTELLASAVFTLFINPEIAISGKFSQVHSRIYLGDLCVGSRVLCCENS